MSAKERYRLLQRLRRSLPYMSHLQQRRLLQILDQSTATGRMKEAEDGLRYDLERLKPRK